ncbi:hypothetical protein OROHE_025377 [Orobanche hederae]
MHAQEEEEEDDVMMIKGKRSKRPRLTLTMATSSSSAADLSGGDSFTNDVVSGSSGRVIPSPSHSGGITQSTVEEEEEEEDMANCLILLAKGSLHPAANTAATPDSAVAEVYRCKTCDRSFPSFQALGGHRASHGKPSSKLVISEDLKKPLSMIRGKEFESDDVVRDGSTTLSIRISRKSRVHECSICGAEFASGQALGGHMRRHRSIPAPPPPTSSGHVECQGVERPRNILSLDLNLPAPEDDHAESNKFPFSAASPLVDCHY